eukprot:6193883-Pleurochrysis_carterae.AAC.1
MPTSDCNKFRYDAYGCTRAALLLEAPPRSRHLGTRIDVLLVWCMQALLFESSLRVVVGDVAMSWPGARRVG